MDTKPFPVALIEYTKELLTSLGAGFSVALPRAAAISVLVQQAENR